MLTRRYSIYYRTLLSQRVRIRVLGRPWWIYPSTTMVRSMLMWNFFRWWYSVERSVPSSRVMDATVAPDRKRPMRKSRIAIPFCASTHFVASSNVFILYRREYTTMVITMSTVWTCFGEEKTRA